jgi:uncharacterized protein
MVTLEEVRNHKRVMGYIDLSNRNLGEIGYTEHGQRHTSLVASIARNILLRLGYDERTAELAAISGYMHDIGNVVSRHNHGQTGPLIAMDILREMNMDDYEIGIVMSAIGNHEEEYGEPVNPVSAALILADKSDVHRSRVRNTNETSFDIHDRVNYAAERSFLRVDEKEKTITLELTIDTSIAQVMEYFEIFLSRMTLCRKAASYLNCRFVLTINKAVLL